LVNRVVENKVLTFRTLVLRRSNMRIISFSRRTNVRNVSTFFSTTRCTNLFLYLQLSKMPNLGLCQPNYYGMGHLAWIKFNWTLCDIMAWHDVMQHGMILILRCVIHIIYNTVLNVRLACVGLMSDYSQAPISTRN